MEQLRSLYHWLFAALGNIVFGFPSRKLYVVGVTGTKGKSSTVELMSALFDAAGEKTAVLSSVTRKVGKERARNTSGNSMPGRFAIQKFLHDAVNAKCTYAFVEVTSQGVLQHRHEFIDWNAAVFLNLSPEHIEAHGSFEEYKQAKLAFFRYVAASPKKDRTFLVNEEDAVSPEFAEAVHHNYGNAVLKFSGKKFLRETLGAHFDLRTEKARNELGEWLLAEFNLENAAAAVALAQARGVSWSHIEKGLTGFKGVPGRFEIVQKKPFVVVVDYAHTPDSLRKVYATLRNDYCMGPDAGKLICVLGSAGGGRDKWKRPEMGRAAAKYCSEIVLTDEDSYDEKPEDIMNAIKAGILEDNFPVTKIYEVPDRREAIRKAISLAQKGDVVVMTGKGSETSIHTAHGKTIPWNEREIAMEILKERRA